MSPVPSRVLVALVIMFQSASLGAQELADALVPLVSEGLSIDKDQGEVA